MTDKVQKIREKVMEMVNSINPFIPDEDGKNSDYEAGKLDAATHILQIIDSLEEPASEKKCMFTKDSYTDEDRKVLCEDCKEKCEYSKKEEPVSIWHDASEDALKDKLLIVEFGGEYQHGYAVKRAGHFEETEWNYTRWCYLSDIKKLQ